jgi:hypothetical protein
MAGSEHPQADAPRVTRTKTMDVISLGDGEYRLEARLTDLSRRGDYGPAADSTGDMPDSSIIHDIALTARVRGPGLEVAALDVQALTVPYTTCPFVLPLVKQLIGKELMSGWRRSVLELSGGTRGCTHVNTLLLGLTEMQTMVFFLKMNERVAYAAETRASGEWIAAGLDVAPQLADVCYSLRRDGSVLARADTRPPDR